MSDFAAALARLDTLDWDRISQRTTGTTAYADWCHGTARHELAATTGHCQTCLGAPGRPIAPAVAVWTCDLSGNRQYLCGSCLAHWQANAVEDPELAGTVDYLNRPAPTSTGGTA